VRHILVYYSISRFVTPCFSERNKTLEINYLNK
jgi:hypothetical protein